MSTGAYTCRCSFFFCLICQLIHANKASVCTILLFIRLGTIYHDITIKMMTSLITWSFLHYYHFSKGLTLRHLLVFQKDISSENYFQKYQNKFFKTNFNIILYKIVIFKNERQTFHPYRHTGLFCVYSDDSLRCPF